MGQQRGQGNVCKLNGEITVRSLRDQTEWHVATMHTIDGNGLQVCNMPGKTRRAVEASRSLALGKRVLGQALASATARGQKNDRQTERQTDRQTDRQTETDRQAGRHTDEKANKSARTRLEMIEQVSC